MELFRLGSQSEPWTKKQIEDFMDQLESEIFTEREENRGESGGEITAITRNDADGNEQRYVKIDGEWEEMY